ncbi:MAG: Holliday junction resolvase RuvX [Limnochordia bacterium]
MNRGRLMALDVGERRIGIAISDLLRITAQPGGTLLRGESEKEDIDNILEMAQAQEVEAFVVGLPRRTSGEEGPEAAAVRRFAAALEGRSGKQVHLADERYTTAIAEKALLEGGVRRARRRERIDQIAASVILQGFLDQQRST